MIKIFNFQFSIFNKKASELFGLRITNKKRINISLFFILYSLFFILGPASAWTIGDPIVPCGSSVDSPSTTTEDERLPCDKCQLLHLADNLVDFVMIGAAPILATAFFIWAGVLMILGGANPGMLSQGKKMFKDTMIGLLIVMMAWLITNILITTLLQPTISQPGSNFPFNSAQWWNLNCSQIFNGGSGSGLPNGFACIYNSDCQSGYCSPSLNICQ